MTPLKLPMIPTDPDFVIGEYSINRTLRELDGQAECWGWMPEPRHMNAFRESPFYNLSLRHFFSELTPECFRFSNRIIRAHSFILWRILDWGCGMDPLARQWLDTHAGGSMTYALRTGCPEYLNRMYETHMRGPGVRQVKVAPPMITAYVDYAERLFGFYPIDEIAQLIPLLADKALTGIERPHDPIYFLSRVVAFLLEAGEPGKEMLAPHQNTFSELTQAFGKRSDEGESDEQSEYSNMTIQAEARTGVQRIQHALATHDAEDTAYLDTIWTTEYLDDTYQHCFGLPLRCNTPQGLAVAGCPEHGATLMRHVVETSTKRWGPGNRHTFAALEGQALYYLNLSQWDESIAVRHDIVDRYHELHGENDPLTLQAAMRLGETYARAERPEEAVPIIKDTLERAVNILDPDHFIVKFCKERLNELEAFQ